MTSFTFTPDNSPFVDSNYSTKAQNAVVFLYTWEIFVVQTQNVSAVYLPKNNFTLGFTRNWSLT